VCDGDAIDNGGYDALEWSRASYGEYFGSRGEGISAVKWDESEITTRAHEWIERIHDTGVLHGYSIGLRDTPAERSLPKNCNPLGNYFINTSIVFGGPFLMV